MNRELTREEAIRLHREMWKDMQTELGDEPNELDRLVFKRKYIEEHFPNELVRSDCFLCEYAQYTDVAHITGSLCAGCPVAWNSYDNPECIPDCIASWGRDAVDYRYSPISAILALPERKV